jgi:hypothetical protein
MELQRVSFVNAMKERIMKPEISTLTLTLALTAATVAIAKGVCVPRMEMRVAVIEWRTECP